MTEIFNLLRSHFVKDYAYVVKRERDILKRGASNLGAFTFGSTAATH